MTDTEDLSIQIYTGTQIQEFLHEYTHNSIIFNQPSIMECSYDGSKLWEIDLQGCRNGLPVKINKESKYYEEVLNALSCCGGYDISVSKGLESKNISDSTWKKWFLDNVANKIMIVDTNFLIRHYFSSLIAPRFTEKELHDMSVNLPRMVILEIERKGNTQNDKKFDLKQEKRLAFYATKELYYLRKMVDYDLIPMYDGSSVAQFSYRAGGGSADAWIRKEIHDMIAHHHKGFDADKIVLLTCDLMNAMAAEAEGITSCYFSRLPKDIFFLGSYERQFLDFFIANAVIFGEVTVDLVTNNREKKESFILEGAWNGKTTSEWYSDSLRFRWRKLNREWLLVKD